MSLKIFKLVIFLLASVGLARFCHHQTSGFRMSKITNNFGPDVEFAPQAPTVEILKLLQGNFSYLGRGLQSFAFVSEDGAYVLKIFNNHLQKKLFWWQLFGARNKASCTHAKLKRTFESYKIASDELKTSTAIIYLHLKPIMALPFTTLIDKLGIAHPLDLSKTCFVLQKRAILAYPWLESLIKKNEMGLAKNSITALVELVHDKCKQGIADKDPLIRTNFGFIDNQPIHIDIGPFYKDQHICNKNIYLPELRRIMASLQDWLLQRSPELADHLHTLMEHLEHAA